MTMRISKDRIDMDDKILEKPILKNYGETVVTANSSTTYTIDLTKGNTFNITLTGNCAFTFANPPISGTAGSFTLILTQDSTGSRTVTWPTAVRWSGGTVPTLSTATDHSDILIFATVNGGTTWYGAISAQGYDATIPYVPVYIPYGYFGGGGTPYSTTASTVNRIEYSVDTMTASVKGPLSIGRVGLAATGNSSFGYFGGGINGSGAISTLDCIDYSNDSATAIAKGPLSAGRYHLASTGDSAFGYFGGGLDGSNPTSTIDRIDYSNDTVTASIKGSLSKTLYFLAATGNSAYGYLGGGRDVSNSPVLIVDRIDYSNDTLTAVAKGPLSATQYRHAATNHGPV